MSLTPARRPSTLAANRYAAAKRPVGLASVPSASGRPAEAPVTRSASLAPVAKRAESSRNDGQILTSLIVAFVILVVVVLTVNVRGTMRRSSSVVAVSGTLTAVHERQSTFRLLNQRFATWRELEARGMTLPAAQAVVKSNATASHWFVSVRDRSTGVICDKTGELFDEGPTDHKPVCREPTK